MNHNPFVEMWGGATFNAARTPRRAGGSCSSTLLPWECGAAPWSTPQEFLVRLDLVALQRLLRGDVVRRHLGRRQNPS